jgi:glycosyltransferase involved in cell wall biosynthesis
LVVRVALDVSSAPAQLAGAGRYIGEVARWLPTLGIESTLVSRRGDEHRWKSLSPQSLLAPVVPNARALRLAYEAWVLGAGVAARNADLWHAPHYTMPRRRSKPTVVTIHDLTYFTNPQWHERSKVLFFRRAITYATRHADVLISVSDFTARQLDELFPEHRPVVVAPLGVDLERFNTDSHNDTDLFHANHLASDAPYILFLGTVEPRKGLDVLLDAFEELARRDVAIELWLAGQTGWGVSEFETQLARHPAAARIRRLGFVDDDVVPALLRGARVVAYPSRGEGFGLPVLEAMACGATVVTSANTVMAEIAGGTAILVEAGNAAMLAAALAETLLIGPSERTNHGQRARTRAEHFTWEKTMAGHVEAYELALGGR